MLKKLLEDLNMKWSVLTLLAADEQGIVAAVSKILFEHDCQLAEASMMRLGANFAIMLRVQHQDDCDLPAVLAPLSQKMNLHIHIDDDVAELSSALEPDVSITVYGADRAGIVAQTTQTLAAAGLNIIDLETAVGGSAEKPIYIMNIEGCATQGLDVLQQAVKQLVDEFDIRLSEIETLRA